MRGVRVVCRWERDCSLAPGEVRSILLYWRLHYDCAGRNVEVRERGTFDVLGGVR